jgi:hypothetical protein
MFIRKTNALGTAASASENLLVRRAAKGGNHGLIDWHKAPFGHGTISFLTWRRNPIAAQVL